MRDFRRYLFIFLTAFAAFILLLFSVSFAQNGMTIVRNPAIFLADISSGFTNLFSKQGKILLELPRDEASSSVSSDPCAYETLTKKKVTGIVFNEVAWMGGKDDYNAEWIELKNISSAPINASLWQVVDTDMRLRVVFPKGTEINPGAFFLLARETKKQNELKSNLKYNGMLRNTGTGLRLFSSSCELEDEIMRGAWRAGDNKTKQTMVRGANGVWYTSRISGGTPGSENDTGVFTQNSLSDKKSAVSAIENAPISLSGKINTEIVGTSSSVFAERKLSGIFLSEVSPGSDVSADDEFIELYNPNDTAISLAGWSVKKKASSGKTATLVSASRLEEKVVPPKSYFLIARESGYKGGARADAWWAKSNSLAYESNTLLLFNGDETQEDALGWTEIPKGKSILRSHDGMQIKIGERSPGSENGF